MFDGTVLTFARSTPVMLFMPNHSTSALEHRFSHSRVARSLGVGPSSFECRRSGANIRLKIQISKAILFHRCIADMSKALD